MNKSINFKNWTYLRLALTYRSYVTCKQYQCTSFDTIFWKNYQNCFYFSVLVIFLFYYINILTALFHHLRVVIMKFIFCLQKQPPQNLAYVLLFWIQEKTCYCYDNVDNYRKLGSEQCYYQDFPNNPDELYGAPNPGSVVVFKYHQTRPVAAGKKNLFHFYSETKPGQITICIQCSRIITFKNGNKGVDFIWTFLYCLHKNPAKINLYSYANIKLIKKIRKKEIERKGRERRGGTCYANLKYWQKGTLTFSYIIFVIWLYLSRLCVEELEWFVIESSAEVHWVQHNN